MLGQVMNVFDCVEFEMFLKYLIGDINLINEFGDRREVQAPDINLKVELVMVAHL